jgi:hypothetical protein
MDKPRNQPLVDGIILHNQNITLTSKQLDLEQQLGPIHRLGNHAIHACKAAP